MASLLRRSLVYSRPLLRHPPHRLPLHPHLLPLPRRYPLHGSYSYTVPPPPPAGGHSAASGSGGSAASAQWAVFWAAAVTLLSNHALYVYERHENQEKENIAAFEKIKEQETHTVSEGQFRKILVDEIPKLRAGIEKIANWIPNDGSGRVEESGDAPAAKGPSDSAPPKEEKVEELPIEATAASPAEDRLFASPLARKLAEDHKVPLSSIKGTGPDGRIVKADIEDYLASGEKGGSKAAPKVDTAAAAS